jgi:hypothetical protein
MTSKGKVKYTVSDTPNFYAGQIWDEWRISRDESFDGLVTRRPTCDVKGSRRKALAIARILNASTVKP